VHRDNDKGQQIGCYPSFLFSFRPRADYNFNTPFSTTVFPSKVTVLPGK